MSSEYPLKHLSVRVPWHDAGWNGTICKAPQLNGACVKLTNIAAQKREEYEIDNAGKLLKDLNQNNCPPCIDESAAFMAGYDIPRVKNHPSRWSDYHKHLKPTEQHYPKYSTPVVPFRWMMKDEIGEFQESLNINADLSREPDLPYSTNWVNEATNQKALLDGFKDHFQESSSLCFFYARYVPFVETTDNRRILIGVGKITAIGDLTKYEGDPRNPDSWIWERPIQHSIRPEDSDETGEGFLMPYQEIIRHPKADSSVDWETYTAFTMPEQKEEFSYRSELVTHGGAISALLSMDATLSRIQKKFGIDTEDKQRWINEQLSRLWKVRGPFPGLGAVLHTLRVPQSTLRAQMLQKQAGEANDPWQKVDEMFQASELPRELINPERSWRKSNKERRKFLRLLSRFELSNSQADRFSDDSEEWNVKDQQVLDNPYVLYEASRQTPNVISPMTIDRGIFPSGKLPQHNLLEISKPFNSTEDLRRVHAFVVYALEKAALDGHTWQSCSELGKTIREITAPRECQVNKDILSGLEDLSDIGQESGVVSIDCKNTPALQLDRYRKIRDLVREKMDTQINSGRSVVRQDWGKLIAEKLENTYESSFHQEQTTALEELAESNFSVLVGPAGSGKTTLLGLLCSQEEILKGGVLILAPTGKARVGAHKLVNEYIADESEYEDSVEAMTIAQFLSSLGRYKWGTNQYLLDGKNIYKKSRDYKTVIIDEASMITEDMLGSTLEALLGVRRWVFVGDPAQLPPIGAGRPFFDIVNKLRPADILSRSPRVAPGYAELIYVHRQKGKDSASRWARLFSAQHPPDDDLELKDDDTIQFVRWKRPEDFQESLKKVLHKELNLKDKNDQQGFSESLGGEKKRNKRGEIYYQFNKEKAVEKVESWQILSPLRGMPFGVNDINRQIHEHFRRDQINYAKSSKRTPDPMGAEQIVYGDKVINVINHKHRVSYGSRSAYIANGEIGITAGALNSKLLRIEFSSQRGYTYDFKKSELDSENRVYLELAYALTVHKAQGSQFDLVILILPLDYREFSRELIYTALTRHKKRLVVMHQKPLSKLGGLREQVDSETENRLTNLFD